MRSLPQRVWPIAVLAARVAVGLVFMAHGLGKLADLSATSGMFSAIGVPLPGAAATAAAIIETLGGACLVLGALLPLAGTLLALVMAGAWWFVHRASGLYASDGGYETVLGLGAAALLVGLSGGGMLAADRYRTRRAGRADNGVTRHPTFR